MRTEYARNRGTSRLNRALNSPPKESCRLSTLLNTLFIGRPRVLEVSFDEKTKRRAQLIEYYVKKVKPYGCKKVFAKVAAQDLFRLEASMRPESSMMADVFSANMFSPIRPETEKYKIVSTVGIVRQIRDSFENAYFLFHERLFEKLPGDKIELLQTRIIIAPDISWFVKVISKDKKRYMRYLRACANHPPKFPEPDLKKWRFAPS